MKKVISIILIVCTLMLLVSCGGATSDVCGICGGTGYVTNKIIGEGAPIQRGTTLYYRCKGCHGTGKRQY